MARYAAFLKAGSNNFQTTAEHTNAFATDFLIDGVVGAITNTSGVAPMTGAFAVNAQGTPDATVAVSVGKAYVTATPGAQASQRIRLWSDASENVTIAANATGGTRYDWIYLKVDPTNADNPALAGDNAWTFNVSRSTSSSTDNGTPPTYGLVIAVVTVANGFTTITNGNIADRRVRTGANAVSTAVNPSTMYNPYKFRAYNTSEQTGLAGGTWHTATLGTEEYDTGNNFAASTFTAPVAGFYHFDGSIASSATAGTHLGGGLRLLKNGTTQVSGSGTWYDNNWSVDFLFYTISDTIQLAAGDTIILQGWFYLSGGTTGFASGIATKLAGHLVSAT